jgi:hypothetical protein
MSFTATEKSKILYYLGYSGFEDDGAAIRAINSLDSHESFMGPMVREILDKLSLIDKDIMETRPLAKAIKDGSIELRAHYTMDHLWRMGRQMVSRLARWTKIQVSGDVFSAGGTERGTDGQFMSGDPSERRINPASGVPSLGDIGDHVPGSGYWK